MKHIVVEVNFPMNRSNNKSCLPVIEDPGTYYTILDRTQASRLKRNF
jgi:hypothetical protein